MNDKLRWQYRFDNFKRAFSLLREAIELKHNKKLSDLEKEGIIQRFEYTWELTWKTIKDYLEDSGIVLDKITPQAVIRAAIEAKVITNREQWMSALDARNKMSHTYDNMVFAQIIEDVDTRYLSLFDQLYEKLLNESMQSL